ncbi:MAG: tetratricopeptide repeat protein [Proteobacteria bacterium]|nr:tetratricopeptide repeat protein [Pseudomonadota bacterium]
MIRADLLSLVQRHCDNSQRSLLTPEKAYAQGYGGYGEALRLMWSGQFSDAASHASALLAEDPDMAGRFAVYRLWIEALAEQSDKASLRLLRNLLLQVGRSEPEAQATFVALRGLVHYELDEMEAARMLARACADHEDNSYCLELSQLVANRDRKDTFPLLTEVPLVDYFHWQTLARTLLASGYRVELNLLLGVMREQCPTASLAHTFEYHLCIESGFYAAAALVAERLTALYPESVDYRYYQAYALYEDGDYPSARRALSELVSRGHGDDAEVIGLLGHTHAKLGNAEEAARCLQRAVSLLKSQGLPHSHLSIELSDVEEELRGDQLDPALSIPQRTRKWLINLSPRRYHELVSSSTAAIDRLLRPMGPEPRTGDICFFATTIHTEAGAQWKIVAIYAVDSVPMWHPIDGYHTALRLVARLPDGLPVDIEMQDPKIEASKSQAMHPHDQHRSYGVYELDNFAIDIIEEAVHMSREDMIDRRRGSSQSRRPTA